MEHSLFASLVEQGRYDEALRAREGLHVARKDVTKGAVALAAALLDMDPPRAQEALEIIRDIVWIYPNLADAAAVYGRAIVRAVPDAASFLDKMRHAFEAAPEVPTTAASLAGALEELGQSDEAARVIREQRDLLDNAIAALPVWTETGHAEDATSMYLDLLEAAVTGWLHADESILAGSNGRFVETLRDVGRDIPRTAESMIGRRRMRHLRCAVEEVLRSDIPGHLLEAGVWRGGACILMRGVLAVYGEPSRCVYVADSFEGLPAPSVPQDNRTGFNFHMRPELAVSRADVAAAFARYDLLDERVVFVEGLFKDTLPDLPVAPIAVLRIDGDWYSSTMDVLTALYDRVSPGGFVICDDYGAVIDSRRAVLEFRRARGVQAPMMAIDGDGVFWRA